MAQASLETSGVDISPAEFGRLSALVHRLSGIVLTDNKHQLVCSRLARRLRALELGSYGEYLDVVESEAGAGERTLMVDLLTTNKTSFFREPAHFEFLAQQVIPEMVSRQAQGRVWSAGCSSGEEAYTLAMCLHDGLEKRLPKGFRVLATDLSDRMLELAREATYPAEAVSTVPGTYQRRYLREGVTGSGTVRVVNELRDLVKVARLNLLERWPMQGGFDAVFCRNVMIYFDRPTQVELVRRLTEMLRVGGHLFVGHSEGLHGVSASLKYVRPAVYQRVA